MVGMNVHDVHVWNTIVGEDAVKSLEEGRMKIVRICREKLVASGVEESLVRWSVRKRKACGFPT